MRASLFVSFSVSFCIYSCTRLMICGALVTKELRECLQSLIELVYESYGDKHLRKRHKGTCSWIFSHENYRCWLEDDDHPILWIYGGPGFGKTVLSAVLSKEPISDQQTSFDQECSVAYFFCDDIDNRLNTVHALLTNILAQHLRQDPNALIHFSNEPVYNIHKEKTEWTVEMLWGVFSGIVNDEKLKPMIVIIDALGMLLGHASFCGCPVDNPANSTDECKEEARTAFLDKLWDLFNGNLANLIGKRLKIVITSRPQISIESYFPSVVKIPLDSNNLNDIASYVHASILQLKKRNFPVELRQEIQEVLIEGSNGVFLWVHLILYDLQTSSRTSPLAIRRRLKTLPKSLPDLYRNILLEIKPENLEAAHKILQWVVWAERPLTLQELAIAIAIQPGHKSMSALSDAMEPDLENVLRSIFGALIMVQDNSVYFVHQSTKDFLRGVISISGEQFSLQSNESNLHITISCLTYLSFDEFETRTVASDLVSHPNKVSVDGSFFHYSCYWLEHMRQLDDDTLKSLSNGLPDLYGKILQISPDDLIIANNILRWVVWAERPLTLQELAIAIAIQPGNKSMSALSDAMEPDLENVLHSIFGALIVVQNNSVCFVHQSLKKFLKHIDLIPNAGLSLQSNDANLHITISCLTYLSFDKLETRPVSFDPVSHSNIASVDDSFFHYSSCYWPDHMKQLNDELQRTPLLKTAFLNFAQSETKMEASWSIYRATTVLPLLELKPYAMAIHYGLPNLVQFLSDNRVDVNPRHSPQGNALLEEACDDKDDIVRFLVEQGADVNAQGGYYGNVLQAAAYEGKDDIVRYLVDQGADVKAQGGHFGNALQAARRQGHTYIVDYLVGRGSDLSSHLG
jgi:hypothetical protein